MKAKAKIYSLDRDYIIKNITIKYRTVAAFSRAYKISRGRFYAILERTYTTKNVPSVEALSKFLKIPLNLMWRT